MKVIRPLLYVILTLAGVFLLFLLFSTLDDYKPDQVTAVANRKIWPTP
jgi:hypothetical protein